MAAPQDRFGMPLGDYRLQRLLGKGAFGAVYLAEHVHDGSQAAIKLLQVQLTHPEDFKAFLNEARTIRLRHPHIVSLLDFGLSGEDQPFLVMEYAAGGTLRDRHAKGSCLPLPTIHRYVQQMASALQYAHERRIIHRDVKPENMLVRADGGLLLSDFGIATVAHSSRSLDLQQGIGGTLPYMAPEQIQGQPRPQSDQYALAVVVYEWIAGQRPFQGTAVEMAMQHAMTAPPSLLELVPTLPKDMEQVVLKALAKDPKERFASVQDFATALEQASQAAQAHTIVSLPLSITGTLPASPPKQQPPLTIFPSQPTPQNHPVAIAPDSNVATPPLHTLTARPEAITLLRRLIHPSEVWCVALSADGPLASGGPDRSVKLWNVQTGQLLHTLTGHTYSVTCVTFSPDGLVLASGGAEIRLWSAQTGQHLRTLQDRHGASSLAFSPDGLVLASSGAEIRLWNVQTSRLLRTLQGHKYAVDSMAFSPDGLRLVSESTDSIKLWNIKTGQLLHTINTDHTTRMALSPDGLTLASGSVYGMIQLWNAQTGQPLRTFTDHTGTAKVWQKDVSETRVVRNVAFSPDGLMLASVGGHLTIKLWNVQTGQLLRTLTGHTKTVECVAFSSDGLTLVSGSLDLTINVWGVKEERDLEREARKQETSSTSLPRTYGNQASLTQPAGLHSVSISEQTPIEEQALADMPIPVRSKIFALLRHLSGFWWFLLFGVVAGVIGFIPCIGIWVTLIAGFITGMITSRKWIGTITGVVAGITMEVIASITSPPSPLYIGWVEIILSGTIGMLLGFIGGWLGTIVIRRINFRA